MRTWNDEECPKFVLFVNNGSYLRKGGESSEYDSVKSLNRWKKMYHGEYIPYDSLDELTSCELNGFGYIEHEILKEFK